MRVLAFGLLFFAALTACKGRYDAGLPHFMNSAERKQMHRGPCFAQDGFGIVRDPLSIKVSSSKNELSINRYIWTGKDASVPEVVIVYQNGVWPPGAVPVGFDPHESIVISFEREKVRYFDFRQGEGCYYERSLSN